MRFLITVLVLLINIIADGQDLKSIVRGKVTERSTGNPLPGVYVIYGRNQGVTTSEEGLYSFYVTPGKLSISYQFLGYKPVVKDFTITGIETILPDISLETIIREIDQVVVSANRTEQRISELSVSMNIIKESFLESNHINDAQELINKTPGIEVLDGQASIRGGSGFSYGAGSRVLALIDGLPMLAGDAGNIKWAYLPTDNISQIEIIKGASSVLYGSSALNGVINFRTADAGNIPVTSFYTEAGFYDAPRNRDWIWWNSSRQFTSTSVAHLQKIGSTDLSLSAGYIVDQGYRRLNEENIGKVTLKLKHYSKRFSGLNFGVSVNSGYTVKRDFVLWENSLTGALKQQESSAIQLHGKFLAIDPFISLRKSTKWKQDLRIRFQSTTNHFPESEKTNSDAYSLFTEYQLWHKIAEWIDITAGISENYNLVNSNMYLDHRSLNLAGYSQFEIRPVKRLKAVAGVRIENNSLDGISDKIVPVFRAGLNWQAAEYTFIRASYGQGYRFPSIAEKHASTTLGSVVIFPNPDVLPESGWSAEAGVKQGIALGKITGQADLSAFLAQNENMIEYFLSVYTDPLTGIPSTGFKARNIEQSLVYGAELEIILNSTIGKVNTTLNGGYTFIYPAEYNPVTKKSTGEFLKYRRMHSGKISLEAVWKKLSAGINLYARSKILKIDSFFLTPETGEVILPGFPDYWEDHNKGYLLLDTSLGYQLNEILKISISIKNLTNAEYMGRPGDIQPQRSFSMRISSRF